MALLAGVIVGAMSLLAAFVLTESASNADMRIETHTQNIRVGDTFTAGTRASTTTDRFRCGSTLGLKPDGGRRWERLHVG